MKKKYVYLLLIILAAVFASCSNEDVYIPPDTSVVDQQFNFHVVAPGIWRSSQPNEKSIKKMKLHGLKTIINLRGSAEADKWESVFADSLGLNYFNEPLDARYQPNKKTIEKILQIVSDTSNQPVLFHCLGGKDRTGLIAGIYKMQYLKADFDDVKKETIMFGHDAEKYPEVINSIYNWKTKTEK